MDPSIYFTGISRVWKVLLKVLNPYEEVEGKRKLTKLSKLVLFEHSSSLIFMFVYMCTAFTDYHNSDFFEIFAEFLCVARNLVYQASLFVWYSTLDNLAKRILADRDEMRSCSDHWPLTLRYCKNEFWTYVVVSSSVLLVACSASLSVFWFRVNENRLPLNFHVFFLPFDGISFNWMLNYLYQVSFFVLVGLYFSNFMPSPVLLINHTCWGYDNLIVLVQKLQLTTENHKRDDPLQVDLIDKQLKNIVERSLLLMEWRDKVQDYLELIFLLEFSCLSYIMCMALYSLFMNPTSSIIMYGVIVIVNVQLFCYCWLGTRVVNRIETLAAEIYEIKWYLMKPSQQKDIQLLLIMAQNMKGFNGIFDEVNMETFKKVLQCTYTLITFLKSTK